MSFYGSVPSADYTVYAHLDFRGASFLALQREKTFRRRLLTSAAGM